MTIVHDASAHCAYADLTMNDRFTKVYESILDSSIWFEDSDTRCVWLTLMALADMDGMVSNTIPGLARRAFPKPPLEKAIELTVTALELFMSPDEYSRTETDEGRRLRKVEGGWVLINYLAYRDRRRADARKEQNKEAQQRARDRKKASARVSTRVQGQQKSAQEEGEGEGEEEIPQTPTGAEDSKSQDPLLEFAVAWRELTGRSEFKEFVASSMVGGTEAQALAEFRKACGGSVVEFRARVTARLANDRNDFNLSQTLVRWSSDMINVPAKAPAARSGPTAAYHAPLKPRDDDGPPVTFDEAMASQEAD